MMWENVGNMFRSPNDKLHFSCKDCGREAVWPATQVIARFGQWAPPYAVRNRVKCGGCGSKRVKVHL